MRFDNCFCTNSICTPSRAVILTGKYTHINGVPVFNRFDGRQPKTRQVSADGRISHRHDRQVAPGSDPTGFSYWNILPGQGVYHNPVFIDMGQRKKHTGYCTDLIADFRLEFLKTGRKDKPFFLMCHHKAPHRPWQPDEKHIASNGRRRDHPSRTTFVDKYAHRSNAAARRPSASTAT